MSFYKFENYTQIGFPVYSSSQKGIGNIVVPHYHGEVEILKINSGKATVFIDTKRIECEKDDIVIIPPYCVHSVVSKSDTTVTTGVVFNTAIVNNDLFNKPLSELLNRDYITDYLLNADSQEIGVLIENVYKIYKEIPFKKALIYAEIIKICHYLHEKYNVNANVSINVSKIAPVIQYVNEHYSEEISLSNLSKLINVSNNHLIRLFKNTTNKTPVKYINDIRIEQALKLLINSNLTITEIALQVGFSNVNYMSNVFKSTLKIKPSEYRKKARS